MFKYAVMVCSLVCFLSAAPLWAAEALVGKYTSDYFDNLQVVVKNDATFRINILEDDEAEDIFMLMADGKRWLVGRDDNESGWEAFDFESLVQFIEAMEGAQPDSSAKAVITKSGAQTVAGIAGEGFSVKYPDEAFNLVLTENKDVVVLTRAMFMFLKDIDEDDMNVLVDTVARINAENNKDYGLLQYTDDFVFTGLERKDYPDSYFTLPEGVEILDLNDMFGE